MTDVEDRELEPLYLMQRIDSLQWLLGMVIGTMTKEQREYIESRLEEYSNLAEDEARRRDTDPARDEAVIIYRLEEQIRDATGEVVIDMAERREEQSLRNRDER